MGKIIGAIVAVFVAWCAMDFVIHGLMLQSIYAKTPDLWRPQEEYRYGLMYLVTLVAATSFVMVFAFFFKEKNLMAGLKYGALFGIGTGISMGYGSFSYMPIPYYLALSWFLSDLVRALVAGGIVGAVLKDQIQAEP